MDKSLLIYIIIVLLLAGVVTILLVKSNKKTFRVTRHDERSACKDKCFKQFPHQLDYDDRQQCMSECLKDEELMVKYKSLSPNWIDKFNNCVNQQCNVEQCYNSCDTTIIPPIKPERAGYLSDEDFYNALDEWTIAYANYLQNRENCYNSCDNGTSGECRKECCINAKMCNDMKSGKESCINSCKQVSFKPKCKMV